MIPLRQGIAMILLAAAAWAGASAACSVSVTPLSFGVVDPLGGVATDSAGTVTVTCPEATSYVIAISAGSGAVNDRRMSGPAGSLGYQLYTDAGLNYIWGDGAGGTSTVSGGTQPTQEQHTVYGRIPSQPLARAGQYSDLVIVTVSF